MIPRSNTFGGNCGTAQVGVISDPGRNLAILERGGEPVGVAFCGLRGGAIRIDACVAAHWFLFGSRLMGVEPAELDRHDFIAAQEHTNRMLGLAAVSATRCGVTDPAAIAVFFEASFRGQLPDYELAFFRLLATGASQSGVASVLNSSLPEWQWQVQCAFPDAQRRLAGIMLSHE